MRRVNRLTTAAKPPYLSTSSSAFFSTSSGGGSGRGRGGGSSSGPPRPQRVPGQTLEAEDDSETPPPPLGHGRGRLPPIPSSPLLPSFSSWNSSASHSAGRGRPSPDAPPPPPPSSHPRQPIFFRSRDEGGGLGRGKPSQPSDAGDENRHLRRRPQPPPPRPGAERPGREEAVKKAMDVLRRGDGATAAALTRGGRRGGRGRGTRGRGGGGGRRYDRDAAYQDYAEGGGVVDDEAVIEDAKKRLEKTLGPEKMVELEEILEEIKDSVLPDMEVEECWHKFEAQLMIDMEPEYMMEFDRNPDIDEEHEQPAMSLRDALESIKPTLMRADGIKNEEEWEKAVEMEMKNVPKWKALIYKHHGPPRMTAKKQQQVLERVVKTLPDNIPSSVKSFTDRAFLSLQSNPGWGFDKKYVFMNKLVREVSEQYK